MKSRHFLRRIRPLLFASLTLLFGYIDVRAVERSSKGHLDGKAYLVEMGEKGKASDGKDTYIFREGKFRSRYYERKYGFEAGYYTSEKTGGTITFVVDTPSKKQGTIHWVGTVDEGKIDVSYTWSGRRAKWYQATQRNPSKHWARSVTEWATEDPGPPGGEPASHILDGKTFLVKSGEEGKEASHHDDYLIFQDGRFVSTDCGELLDFRESDYSATVLKDGIRFRAQSTSPTHGTMIWDGTVRGESMDAMARWIDKRWYWTIDRMYWFRGKLF